MLRRLAERAHSRHELEQALQRRDTAPDVIAEVLDRLTEVGLIDDAAFAQAWVESRQQRKHLSRRKLRDELHRKGIDSHHIETAMEQVDPDAEYAAALEFAQRKVRAMTRLEPQVRWRRLAGALARRGFSSSVVHQVLNEVLGRPGADPTEWSD